ncbi:MAG TPA: STAS domain-containing protein [Chthoniobacter sp.]|jgi:anti-sigma B factor antagonist
MNLAIENNETLQVTELKELSGAAATNIRDQIRGALKPAHQCLEIDLSETAFVDSSGLGALIALHKTLRGRGGQMRLVNPSQTCLQLLELTRLHRTFEIVTR